MTDSAHNRLPDLTFLRLPHFPPGEVWLPGAGPGDPGLLTLHAVNALAQADIILHDALVDDAVLRLARPGIAVESAGKRGGRPSPAQQDITARLIALAGQGLRVLRLKGGDPFVFGRGGEEALGLAQAGISFRVIPGVTAGLAGLAYANIPATTRATNHGVFLVTGHDAPDTEHQLDWPAVARTGLPIIIYMGMKRLPLIAQDLLAGGLSPGTPVAIVRDATRKQQRVLMTTLEHAAAQADAAGLRSPAIIAIGEIVALRDALAPFAISLAETS